MTFGIKGGKGFETKGLPLYLVRKRLGVYRLKFCVVWRGKGFVYVARQGLCVCGETRALCM